MNASLSTRQIRLVALLVLVVVAGGGYLVMTKHNSTTSNAQTTASSTPTHTTSATTTPTPTKTHSHAATPSVTRVAVQHGLPIPVARALAKNRVVVVSVVTPNSEVDRVAWAEALLGARAAHAGFVVIDAFHQRTGTAILRKLGVVNTPVTLVVRRPYVITFQSHGFADNDVVEQAVADARG